MTDTRQDADHSRRRAFEDAYQESLKALVPPDGMVRRVTLLHSPWCPRRHKTGLCCCNPEISITETATPTPQANGE